MNEEQQKIRSLADSESSATLSSGTMIGEKYRVRSLIGSGGMGSVYRVQQIFLGKDCALKVLDLHNQTDVSVRRFQQEARTTAQLRHPNLVEVHDFGVFGDSQPYLVMDIIEGPTLAQVLKRSGRLHVDFVISLAVQLSSGLVYAHSKGVVHRDIKPGNIIVLNPDAERVTEGSVKILDFGIAKIVQSEDGEIQELTKAGEIFGSPIYMSPEQCKGTAIDRRSDIYSLGCVIFECLTGSPPFLADSAMSTMVKRLTQEPVSLKEGSLGLEFSPALESIVRKMLAVEADQRYQDLTDLIEDLKRLEHIDEKSPPAPLVIAETEAKLGLISAKEVWLIAVTALVCCGLTASFDRFVLPALSSSDQPITQRIPATNTTPVTHTTPALKP
jgi:serine/threonine protein kinase